jgi:hypothetical protein
MHDLPLNLGNIVVFDQNKEHKIVFPNDEEGEVKFGIALFLDKI